MRTISVRSTQKRIVHNALYYMYAGMFGGERSSSLLVRTHRGKIGSTQTSRGRDAVDDVQCPCAVVVSASAPASGFHVRVLVLCYLLPVLWWCVSVARCEVFPTKIAWSKCARARSRVRISHDSRACLETRVCGALAFSRSRLARLAVVFVLCVERCENGWRVATYRIAGID